MNSRVRYLLGLLLLALLLVAASPTPAGTPPLFYFTWGWGVQDGSSAFQVCSTDCQIGLSGIGDGQLDFPQSLAVDAEGDVYVADGGNSRIEKFDSHGTFLTTWGEFGTAAGEIKDPLGGIVVDAAGNVYVSEFSNHRIQKFDSNGIFLTKWGTVGPADGQFVRPYGVAADASGYIYVGDQGNQRIQKFGPALDFLIAESDPEDGHRDRSRTPPTVRRK